MHLPTAFYDAQQRRLPKAGNHIIGTFNENRIIAYVPSLGSFYGDSTVSRPVWVTLSFMWVMQQSAWLTKMNHETLETMSIQRTVFEELLSQSVHQFYADYAYESEDAWRQAIDRAQVIIKWEQDTDPSGVGLVRKCLHIGIHSRLWMQYVMEEAIVTVEDFSASVKQQKANAKPPFDNLVVPQEAIYPIGDASLALHLGLSDS